MRYLIVEAGLPYMDLLPARTTREEAQNEVDRINAHRMDSNARHDAYKGEGRGSSFLRPHKYEHMLEVKEIT